MGEDVIFHAAAGDDGSYVLAGWTNGTWAELSDDSFDVAAIKLDADGAEIWRYQVLTNSRTRRRYFAT